MIILRRTDGLPRGDYQNEIDLYIISILTQKGHMNADKIRLHINKQYGLKLGWITVKRHLDYLLRYDKVKIIYESDGIKKIRVYGSNIVVEDFTK